MYTTDATMTNLNLTNGTDMVAETTAMAMMAKRSRAEIFEENAYEVKSDTKISDPVTITQQYSA